jgi:transposase, IS5 family
VAQTRRRLSGDTPGSATRLISLHDPDARPIAKGRLNRPVEFGYKAQVVDNEDGIVLDYDLREGNPADAPQLAPAIEPITARTGKAPGAVTADRGYGEARVDAELRALGVRTIAIPRKGRPGAARQAVQRRRSFRELVKWRTGCEGRISHLKHGYGWARSGLAGRDRTATWCGHGIFAHNLVKITRLAAE